MLYFEDLEKGNFTERDIQDYFCEILKQRGISYDYEQRLSSNHRADVVVGDTVIEFKRTLKPVDIYQARGQAETYSDALGGRKILLVGCLPKSAKSAQAALNLVATIHENSTRVKIIFIDVDKDWKPPSRGNTILQSKTAYVKPRKTKTVLPIFKLIVASLFVFVFFGIVSFSIRSTLPSCHKTPNTFLCR